MPKNKDENFRDFWVKIQNNDFCRIQISDMNLNVIYRKLKKTMSATDLNSNMPFLRNEFSKNFEDLFNDRDIYRNNSYKRSNEKLELKV